jgi:hypothetical protein
MHPDFLIIGGVRCGTTSLYSQLKRHPSIFMSTVKEPDFFIHQGETLPDGSEVVTSPEAYEALFDGAEPGQKTGEASATYLYMADVTAERIHRRRPDVKIVAQLRHPVERAYSQFRMARMVGRETVEDFAEALRLEDERVAAGEHVIFHYRRQSLYHAPLSRFLALFDASQVQVSLFDDFVADPQGMLARTYEFLDVEPAFESGDAGRPRFSTRNPRSEAVDRLLRRPGAPGRMIRRLVPGYVKRPLRRAVERTNRAKEPSLDPGLRSELLSGFRDDVLRLQGTLGRDLGAWLR